MSPDFDKLIAESIDIWFAEDIGDGDHTTLSTIPAGTPGTARLIAKDTGIIAGLGIASRVIKKFDPALKLEILIHDGSAIKYGDVVFKLEGEARSILQVERLVLNLLQRLSGIATRTNEYASRIADLRTRVLDTRKTTPGLRILEKEAVRLGGGMNHRIGLFDMILIKDNHIDFCGGIEKAIQQAKDYIVKNKSGLKIEVEARSLDDVKEILRIGGVHRILLDNFGIEATRKAVELINGQCETESSGGITLNDLRSYAECGVDFISVGALTHQIKSLDLSLKAKI